MPEITLFEFAPTRSQRAAWILAEAQLSYQSVTPDDEAVAQLMEVHPLGKFPAAIIDGEPLFESAAITTAIADLVPQQQLVATPGTWSRTLHDQWTQFLLTEMEAWLWSSGQNTFILPAEERVPEIHPQNEKLFRRAAGVLDTHLGQADFILDNRFSATDVIAGYTCNWAFKTGWLTDFVHLERYLNNLMKRDACTLDRPDD